MRRNDFLRFNPRQYEEYLSPFGRQVLGTLIKQWNANRDRKLNSSLQQQAEQARPQRPHHIRYNNAHRRVITFGESTIGTNDLRTAQNLEAELNDDCPFEFPSRVNLSRHPPEPILDAVDFRALPEFSAPSDFTFRSALPAPPVDSTLAEATVPTFHQSSNLLPVPTSAELVNIAHKSTRNDEISFSRGDLIIPFDKTDVINESRDVFDAIEDNIGKLDDAIEEARNILEECRTTGNVNWDDMFDTELFEDGNAAIGQKLEASKHYNNEKVFNIQFPSNTTCDINCKADETYKETKSGTGSKNSKRKNQPKVTDVIPKKVKKIKSEINAKSKTVPKTIARKEIVKDSINNWLNEVDPTNPVEDSIDVLEAGEQIATKPQVVIQKGPPQQPSKRVVQAQLANKGGIMKFDKPTKNLDENQKETTKTDAATSENKTKDKDKLKEKKPKSKFVAPIKSQIPVKDLTYEILEVDDTNGRKLKLNATKDQEIVALLLYSNGFCQLNSHHTDDACLPEAVMFYLDGHFFYLNEVGKEIADVVIQMLQNNTLICYDGKALLIYLTSKLKLEFDVTCSFKIVDVKIGGSLLEPDNPPETYSALQRLAGSEPEFTIATTCAKQKAAWYATLLRGTVKAVREKLELEDLWQVFVDIEMEILPIIADMEQRGVCVDTEKLKEMEKILVAKIKQVESECTAAAGRSFQINSTVQVRALIYDELKLDEKAGLNVRGTLTTGAKSTSETMLKSLVSVHPLPRLILEYRHLHKALATFLQGIAQYVRSGVVRPVWVQTAAATGRIASSNPNLQAIPKVPFSLRLFPENGNDNTEESLRFRSVYVSRAGYVLLAADWRHVECRVFARAAADTSLQRALEAPDLFRRLAADWLKKPEEEISSEDRERTKRIVYASLYGAGPRKLMDILNVDYAQALSIAASFDRTFPSLRSFGRRVAADCLAAGGRVSTLCGRARTLPHITSADAAQRSHAERQALNFIVQGSAADVCKLAMGRAVRALLAQGLRARLLLQIHDELVWEVYEDHLPHAAEVIRTAMEQCGSRAGMTSLPVALSAGRNWGQLEPYPQTSQGSWPSQPEPFET